MRSNSARLFGWRGVTLMVVGVVIGTLVLAPGIGLAAKFLTKQQVKKRYLGNTTVVAQSALASTEDGTSTTVTCPPGKQATGGGASAPGVIDPNSSSYSGIVMFEDRPVASGTKSTGWYVEVVGASTTTPSQPSYTAYAVCSA